MLFLTINFYVDEMHLFYWVQLPQDLVLVFGIVDCLTMPSTEIASIVKKNTNAKVACSCWTYCTWYEEFYQSFDAIKEADESQLVTLDVSLETRFGFINKI